MSIQTLLATLLLATIPLLSHASELCDPFPSSAEEMPLLFLDLPDPIISRVTQAQEEALLTEQVSGAVPAPLQKLYCDIGMFEMRVRFVQPVEDDAIHAMVTEAVYEWDADAEPAGWVLSTMGSHPLCARGDEPFAELCP